MRDQVAAFDHQLGDDVVLRKLVSLPKHRTRFQVQFFHGALALGEVADVDAIGGRQRHGAAADLLGGLQAGARLRVVEGGVPEHLACGQIDAGNAFVDHEHLAEAGAHAQDHFTIVRRQHVAAQVPHHFAGEVGRP